MAVIRALDRLAWPEVEALLPLRLPAILPVGACEQHGAHLPLTVDTDLAHGVAARLAALSGALLLPPIAYGETFSARSFPGTVSLSPETLEAVAMDVGRSLLRTGLPALVTLNGHFGNRDPLARAARRLGDEGLPVLTLDYPGLEALAARHCASEPAGPGFFHADEVETAMMLALRPDAVHMDRAAPAYPAFPDTFGMEPWQIRDVSPSGVFGDPRPATAATGEALIEGIAAGALDLLVAFLARHGLPAPTPAQEP